MKSIAIILLSLSLTLEASAQAESGPYVGVGLGYFDLDMNSRFDDTALSYRIYGGYRFGRRWSLEGSYLETQDLTSSETATIPTYGTVTSTTEVNYDVLEVRGLAHFGAFFVGAGYWDADLEGQLTSNLFSGFPIKHSDAGASVLLGGQWNLGRRKIRVEFEHFDTTDDEIRANTIGVSAHFGF